MEVVSYKKMSGNVYKVTLDNGEEYKLYDELILKYELLIDRRLDEKKLEKILEENHGLKAYFKALKYIGLKMRTELEVRRYLKKYEFSAQVISQTIRKFKLGGYLDERKYAKAFVNDAVNLGMNGPKKIGEQLTKLGIEEKISKEFISRIDRQVWLDKIEKLIYKKSKTNRVGEALFKSKVYSDLLVGGYHSEDIKCVLENYSLDDREAFMKEANKVYNKLCIKFVGTELKLKFKAKMYSKGFDGEAISEFLDGK